MSIEAPAAPAAPASPAAPAAPAAPAGGGSAPSAPAGGAPPAPAGGSGGAGKGGAPAAPAPGQPAAPGDSSRKRVYTVDGKRVEVSDDQIDTLIQKGLSSGKRFEEAAKYRQDAELIAELMRSNPMAMIERASKLFGHDGRKVVEDWLWENHYKLEQMTPEQREADKNKKELERLRAQNEDGEKKRQAQEFEKAKEGYRAHFERDIIGALEETGLPKAPWTVQRMAFYIQQALKAGVKIEAKQVAPLVKQDYEGMFRQLIGPMNSEALVALLGETGLKRVREYELARLKSGGVPGAPAGAPPAAPPPAGDGQPKEKLTMAQMRERLDKKFGKI